MSHVLPEAREGHIIRIIRQRLGRVFRHATEARYEDVVLLPASRLVDVLAFLKADPDTDLTMLVDITCVDRGEEENPRYEVRYRVRSPRLAYRLTAIVEADEENPTVPSLTEHFRSANWLERELWEMFGIYPDGHPDLRSLLLYDDFAGSALRRDYPADKDQPLVPRVTSREPRVIHDERARARTGELAIAGGGDA